MKALMKQYYQQFVDGINFPTIIYFYETGRVVSYNRQAIELLGKPVTTVSKLRASNPTLKLSDEILNNGHHTFYNERFYASNQVVIEIDCEVSSICVEQEHLIVVFFDYSFKQYFVRHNKYQLPRIVWFNKKHEIMGSNESFRRDLGFSEKDNSSIQLSEILDEETDRKLSEDREHLYTTKKPVNNMLQLMKPKNEKGFFCKIDRVPIFNKNKTVVGLLSVYMLIFNREEYEHFYSVAMRENNILNQMISKTETIAISWMRDIQYTIQYVSSNVINLGYTAQDCYSGAVTIDSVMSELSKETFIENLHAIEDGPNSSFNQKAHIRKADGSFTWVQLYVGISKRNNQNYYYECLLQEIEQKTEAQEKDDNNLFQLSLPSERDGGETLLNNRMQQFCTYFQPIVHMQTEEIIGLEAIWRYKSDLYGFFDPKEYLTTSEYLALSVPLSEFSIKKTVEQFARLKQKELKLYIPINSLQLIQPNFSKKIKRIVQEAGIPPENIVLQVKQSIALEDHDLMKEILLGYKAEGFEIMLHHFNGCQISLNMLEGLPIDYLKTDKSLMEQYGQLGFSSTDFDDAMNVINNCNRKVFIDGIEFKRQFDFIKFQAVHAIQGNYLCVPLSYDNVVKKLEKSSV